MRIPHEKLNRTPVLVFMLVFLKFYIIDVVLLLVFFFFFEVKNFGTFLNIDQSCSNIKNKKLRVLIHYNLTLHVYKTI